MYENWLQEENNTWQQHSGYLPDVLTQRAVRDIATLANSDKPWFMMAHTPLPHGPLHTPPKIEKNNLSDDEKYRAMIHHGWQCQRIISCIAAHGATGQYRKSSFSQ
ncbi:MAG: sulfatase-like hydrolase/transferase [Pseudomonadales bacterium]